MPRKSIKNKKTYPPRRQPSQHQHNRRLDYDFTQYVKYFTLLLFLVNGAYLLLKVVGLFNDKTSGDSQFYYDDKHDSQLTVSYQSSSLSDFNLYINKLLYKLINEVEQTKLIPMIGKSVFAVITRLPVKQTMITRLHNLLKIFSQQAGISATISADKWLAIFREKFRETVIEQSATLSGDRQIVDKLSALRRFDNALEFVCEKLQQNEIPTLKSLRHLIKLLLNQGKIRSSNVVGELFDRGNFPGDRNVKKIYPKIINYMQKNIGKINPLILVTRVKQLLLSLHPLPDINGRFTRLIEFWLSGLFRVPLALRISNTGYIKHALVQVSDVSLTYCTQTLSQSTLLNTPSEILIDRFAKYLTQNHPHFINCMGNISPAGFAALMRQESFMKMGLKMMAQTGSGDNFVREILRLYQFSVLNNDEQLFNTVASAIDTSLNEVVRIKTHMLISF